MKTVTIDQAVVDLVSMVKHSLSTGEEITISTDSGAVIIIPQDDYEAMQETFRLITDKKSLSALLKGHKDRDEGKSPVSFSVEEVFNDL